MVELDAKQRDKLWRMAHQCLSTLQVGYLTPERVAGLIKASVELTGELPPLCEPEREVTA